MLKPLEKKEKIFAIFHNGERITIAESQKIVFFILNDHFKSEK